MVIEKATERKIQQKFKAKDDEEPKEDYTFGNRVFLGAVIFGLLHF